MSERKEKLEYLIKEYRDLDKQMYKMYIEHDIQTDVYGEMEKRLKDVMEVVNPRIDMILEFYKTLPKGEWCKSKNFSDWEKWRKGGCKTYKPDWISTDLMCLKWLEGYDDGYPETAHLGFELELLLEDSDDEIKRIILKMANEDAYGAKNRLEDILSNEEKCLNELDSLSRAI